MAELVPAAKVLRIVTFGSEPGFYLLHFDDEGNELTDTYHETLEDAMAQANWEFGVSDGDWSNP